MLDPRVNKVQEELFALEANRDLATAKSTIRTMVELILPHVQANPEDLFRIYNDKDGKLKANAGWFQADEVIADRLAVYAMDLPSDANLDVKVFGVNKANKGTISWAVGLTPNFEDEPFNGRFNVGIDFFVPKSMDRVIVALSKSYVIRTIEFKGTLTATFLEILSSWAKISDTSRKAEVHNILWGSLDLAPINKRFYEGISRRFVHLRQFLEQSEVLDSNHAAQFANRLIGRVIFTWFLDKKNFLNGEMNYFASTAFEDDTQYYREKLESLFFEVLNVPFDDRTALDNSTPYLNGGLFEPKPGDLYQLGTLSFPRGFFDDLFSFLRSYNFTTDESTSEFQQVAIDPEMLGRIFENLLAEVNAETGEQARKAKGAFYTPRQIVDFMCKEALKGYLRTKFPNDDNIDSRLFQLVDATERQFQDQDHNWRRDLKPYKDQIIYSLDNLRVLDPACGSGAFPIGMMQLLVKVYSRLETRFDAHKTKLGIIERNLFGVDIEPMAVEISRLRAWLALVVDEGSGRAAVKPLPNLDFKFVCANSLIPLDSSTQVTLFEDLDLDSKLQDLREAYFSTQSDKKKSKLKQTYLSMVDQELTLFGESIRTSQLKTFRPFEADSIAGFFDSGEMFGVEDFQIVIGNPPYLDYRKIDSATKSSIRKYRLAGHSNMVNLYTYFFELGISLLGKGGLLAFISPQQYLIYPNCKGLRDIFREHNLVMLADFARVKVFDASTYTFVSILEKSTDTSPAKYLEFSQLENLESPIRELEIPNPISEPVNISDYGTLIAKIEMAAESKLDQVATVFCASSSTSLELSSIENIGPKFLTASDIFQWRTREPRQRVSLESYGQASAAKQLRPVIYTSRMTKSIRAVAVENGEFLGGKVNVVTPNDSDKLWALEALLNSKLLTFWYREKYSMQHMQGGALPINTTELAELPIIILDPAVIEIGRLSQLLHSVDGFDFENTRNQLEKDIFKLYSLDESEIELIEKRFEEYGI